MIPHVPRSSISEAVFGQSSLDSWDRKNEIARAWCSNYLKQLQLLHPASSNVLGWKRILIRQEPQANASD